MAQIRYGGSRASQRLYGVDALTARAIAASIRVSGRIRRRARLNSLDWLRRLPLARPTYANPVPVLSLKQSAKDRGPRANAWLDTRFRGRIGHGLHRIRDQLRPRDCRGKNSTAGRTSMLLRLLSDTPGAAWSAPFCGPPRAAPGAESSFVRALTRRQRVLR